MFSNIAAVGIQLILGSASILALLCNAILIGLTLMYAFILTAMYFDRKRNTELI